MNDSGYRLPDPVANLVLGAAVPVLGVATVAWVFPEKATDIAGPWALPAMACAALALAMALAAEWRWVRGLVVVFGFTIVNAWKPDSFTSTTHFAGVCVGLLAMLLVARLTTSQVRLRFFLATYLASGISVIGLGLAGVQDAAKARLEATVASGVPSVELGLSGLVENGRVNPNALAGAALLIAPLGFAVAIGSRRLGRWGLVFGPLGLATTVVSGVALYVSHSRTAWMALWLMSAGALVLAGGNRLRRAVLGCVVVVPLFLSLAWVGTTTEETFMRASQEAWRSAEARVSVFRQAILHAKDSPWFGIGLNEFRVRYVPNDPAIRRLAQGGPDIAHAHNIVLQTLLDVGIMGSVAYWGLMGIVLRRAQEPPPADSAWHLVLLGAASSVAAVTLFGLSDAVPLGAKVGMIQWVNSGLTLAATRVTRGGAR